MKIIKKIIYYTGIIPIFVVGMFWCVLIVSMRKLSDTVDWILSIIDPAMRLDPMLRFVMWWYRTFGK